MSSISLDLGNHDIYFNDIAEQVVAGCEEPDLLEELAKWNRSISAESGDDVEKAFALEAARKLDELAQWFRENTP